MKFKSIIALCLMGCMCYTLHAENTQKEIDILWKRYEMALKKDLPQTCMSLLSEIKDKSESNRYDMDFFEASRLYVQVGVGRNWKLRDSLSRCWEKEIYSYNEPVVTCRWMSLSGKSREERLEFIRTNESSLRAASHEDFWKKYGAVEPLYRDDYGFVLWELYLNSRDFEKCAEELASYEKDHYPSNAYLEFLQCTSELYGEFISKYEGRGVSLFAKRALLDMEFDELRRNNACGAEYKALYEKCKAYKKEYSHFQKKEKALCSMVKDIKALTDLLTSRSIYLEAKDGIVKMIVSNVPMVSFSFASFPKGEDYRFKKRLVNQKRSFYAPDTLVFSLPDHDDDLYYINAWYRGIIASRLYTSNHISVALRESSTAPRVYLADYHSGKPIEKADIIMENSKGAIAECKDVLFNGFTPLPDEIVSRMSFNDNYTLTFKTLDGDGRQISGSISNYFYPVSSKENSSTLNAVILTDRGIYSPKDTVYFKSIVYKTGTDDCLGTIAHGAECVASLIDADGDEVLSKTFFTNDFGSIAGQFVIPNGRRNGSYSIRLKCRDKSFNKWIRVDEVVLPSYDLQFDDIDRLFFPGDEVVLSGRVISFSGHNVRLAKSVYQVASYISSKNDTEYREFSVSDDGSFTISFPSDKDRDFQYFIVNVRITDLTGETYEFSKSVQVRRSVNLQPDLKNSSEGTFFTESYGYDDKILLSDHAELCIMASSCDGVPVKVPVNYTIEDESGMLSISGQTVSSSNCTVDLSSMTSGILKVKAWTYKDTVSFNILKINPSRESLNSSALWFVTKVEDERQAPELLIGCGDESPLYAIVEVFGANGLLDSQKIVIDEGSIRRVQLEYKDTYPDEIDVNVFAFKAGKDLDYTFNFSKSVQAKSFPLEFISFEDRTLPETKYTFSIKTLPETECVVSVFDKSSEILAPNMWHALRPNSNNSFITSVSLGEMGFDDYRLMKSNMIDYEMVVTDDVAKRSGGTSNDNFSIREDFSNTLAFLPSLCSDNQGNVTFSFSTSGKLSTYYVSVFAHNRQMQNDAIRREMIVTIPVKVSLYEPKYLYESDEYNLRASVSSISSKEIVGNLFFYLDGQIIGSEVISVPAGGNVSSSVELKATDEGIMDVKVVFVSNDNYSDGVRVKIPVLSQNQTLNESYSMVISDNIGREDAYSMLRARFVNTSSDGVYFNEARLYDKIFEVFPSKVEPVGKDIISLCDALYVRELSNRLNDARFDTDSLYRKILDYQNPDGGFAWYEGMNSSVVITSVVLEYFAKLSKQGIVCMGREPLFRAVGYMDKCQFDSSISSGSTHAITFERYMYVRSMYEQVPFDIGDSAELKAYRKWTRDYLSMKNDASQGDLLSKVRKICIIKNLSNAKELARKWGIHSLKMDAALRSSLESELKSILEYAVKDDRGGVYFPNAVMPFRGEIESESYAHSFIADVLSDYAPEIADGIRVWLLIQKDSQKWDSTPSFIDVLSTLMDASPSVKDVMVLSATKSYCIPFDKIKSTSNGFKLKTSYYKELGDGKKVLLSEGDMLHVGDKVMVEYKVWSEDNRSFVRLVSPRSSAFRPVFQQSGAFRLGQAYRDVQTSQTTYMFEVFPEENTTISEEFFVTQSGTFSIPAPYIECAYAPHFRANSASRKVEVI